MARKVLCFDLVFGLNLFQRSINCLNGKSCSFLANQYWSIGTNRIYLLVTFLYMFL